MAYITYKTSDGIPAKSERTFRGTEKKENFKLTGSAVISAVVNAEASVFGSVTLENIHKKLKSESLLADSEKTIPALTGSLESGEKFFTTASQQLAEPFKAYTKGDIVYGTPEKTGTAVAETTKGSKSTSIAKETAKKK